MALNGTYFARALEREREREQKGEEQRVGRGGERRELPGNGRLANMLSSFIYCVAWRH